MNAYDQVLNKPAFQVHSNIFDVTEEKLLTWAETLESSESLLTRVSNALKQWPAAKFPTNIAFQKAMQPVNNAVASNFARQFTFDIKPETEPKPDSEAELKAGKDFA